MPEQSSESESRIDCTNASESETRSTFQVAALNNTGRLNHDNRRGFQRGCWKVGISEPLNSFLDSLWVLLAPIFPIRYCREVYPTIDNHSTIPGPLTLERTRHSSAHRFIEFPSGRLTSVWEIQKTVAKHNFVVPTTILQFG